MKGALREIGEERTVQNAAHHTGPQSGEQGPFSESSNFETISFGLVRSCAVVLGVFILGPCSVVESLGCLPYTGRLHLLGVSMPTRPALPFSSPAHLTRICAGLSLLLALSLSSGCDDSGGSTTPALDTVENTDGTVDATVDGVEETGPIDVVEDLPPEHTELFNGTTVTFGHVIDGDTLDVFVGTRTPARYNIRFKGLAAPECIKQSVKTEKFGTRYQCTADDEYYGLASRLALVGMVEGKTGILTCDDVAVGARCPTDVYDRTLAYIEVDVMDIATEMAYVCAAMSYTSFSSSKRAQICEAEYSAIGAKRGMWAAGTVSAVLNMMSQQTQNWYNSNHDTRCDAALGI